MEQEKEIVLKGNKTEEEIDALKKQYGRVVEVSVTEGDTEHVGYFRRPDMKTMHAVSGVGTNNPLKGGEVLFDNTWLGGSEELRSDAVLKMEAIAALNDVFTGCAHRLKNL